jgi:hypothetical protein
MKKPAARILRQWAREDPPRLLQSALQQARRIEELLEQTPTSPWRKNAFLREQLAAKNKRIGALEKRT